MTILVLMLCQGQHGVHSMNGAGFHSLTSVLIGAPNEAYTEQIKNIMRQRLTQASQSKNFYSSQQMVAAFQVTTQLAKFHSSGLFVQGWRNGSLCHQHRGCGQKVWYYARLHMGHSGIS
jgi:hypothetical protein